jgi:glycerol-1-phosphate dehydrogenase [NAD(P)+]
VGDGLESVRETQVVRVKYGHPLGRGPEATPIGTLDTESFNKSKAMELPRNIVIGHDALHQIGEVCQSLKLGRKALLVADENTLKIAGKTVEKDLAAHKIRATEFLIPDATWEEVREGEERIRKGAFEFALGVGGGRPIDVAKCASFNAGVPFVSVPTAASHDGVVSSRASIQKNGEKVSLAAQTPIAVIMDTGVIAESPFRLLASGCGDIISNLAAVKDWALARNLRNEYFSSYAAALSELAARLVIENASTIKPRLEESAWFVCKALVSSGVAMSIAGSSRPASGSEHKFSHALDRIAKKPGLHGEQCGVGTIMMMYLHSANWQEVRDALLAIGAPTTARALGVTDDEIIQALTHAHEVNKERYTILGDEGLTLEAAERLAKITKVV